MESRRPVRSARRRLSIADRRRSVLHAEHRSRVDGSVAVRRPAVARRVLHSIAATRDTLDRGSSVRGGPRPILHVFWRRHRHRPARWRARSIPIARIHVHPQLSRRDAPRRVRRRDRSRRRSRADRPHAWTVRRRRRLAERERRESRARRSASWRWRTSNSSTPRSTGKYWLPAFQRTEFQASFPSFGQTRPVFRLVSTIGDIAVDDSGDPLSTIDSAYSPRVVVSWAPTDSVDAVSADWERGIGTQSGSGPLRRFRRSRAGRLARRRTAAVQSLSEQHEPNHSIQPRRGSVHRPRAVGRLSKRRAGIERRRLRRLGVVRADSARRRVRVVQPRRSRSSGCAPSARSRRRTTSALPLSDDPGIRRAL